MTLPLLRFRPLRTLLLAWPALSGFAPAVAQEPAEVAPQLRLAAVFGEHMVLQRETEVPVWGWTEPGVTVTLSGDWPGAGSQTAVAGDDGRFQATLQTGAAGGPYALTARAGASTVTLGDVLLGEVWICSGQSNMEWPLKAAQVGSATLAASSDAPARLDRPNMRLFRVAHEIAVTPRADVRGSWQVCSPETAPDFSAVAFYFGCILQDELDVPIGLVQSAWGGTPAEAWSTAATVEQMPGQYHALERVKQQAVDPEAMVRDDQQAQDDWWRAFEEVDPGMRAGWSAAEVPDATWPEMELPMPWEQSPHRLLHDLDGVVWFRRDVEIPASWAGRKLILELGPLDDMDWTWFQGVLVGAQLGADKWNLPRRYEVPAELVVAGKAALAVRVYDTGGAGGFGGTAEQMRLYPADAEAQALPLAGTWKVRQGLPKSALPVPVRSGLANQNSPTTLWNGMMAPLAPMAMRGAIWYQGESNRMRWMEYCMLFMYMINGWRDVWGRAFPFYFVQIAPFGYGGDQGEAAKLREAQTYALSLEATGMATTMDIGNPADIHPRNKHEVGRRLALWAMRDTYGRSELVSSGPIYQSFVVEDGGLRTSYRYSADGLVAPHGLTLFEVAGKDGVWHKASARISEDGMSIYVKSEEEPTPVQIRYAWGAADQAELFNSVGLPAPSFRSHP